MTSSLPRREYSAGPIPLMNELTHTIDEPALNDLTPALYAELHRIAARHIRNERSDHTLQPTALLHEAYLKLSADGQRRFTDKTHFLASPLASCGRCWSITPAPGPPPSAAGRRQEVTTCSLPRSLDRSR